MLYIPTMSFSVAKYVLSSPQGSAHLNVVNPALATPTRCCSTSPEARLRQTSQAALGSRALSVGTLEARKALGLDGYTEEDVTEGERDTMYQRNTMLF